MYRKIAKYIFWLLAIISVAIMVWGSTVGFTTDNGLPVEMLLNWGYILFVVAIVLVLCLGTIMGAISDPKSLVRMGIGILVIAVVAGVAYFTASSDPLVGYLGTQPSAETLKISDTLLNLTYILGAGAILSILFGGILGAIRNR